MNSKRKILWQPNPEPDLVAEVIAVETPPPVQTQPVAETPVPVRTRRVRPAQDPVPAQGGNGHKVLKRRELKDDEKDKIENKLFIAFNGQIGSDLCVEFKTRHMPDAVSIFQITGYVTALHIKVARGLLRVPRPASYETFIREHRTLWRTYDSEKYRSMRRLPPVNQHRKPHFAPVSTR